LITFSYNNCSQPQQLQHQVVLFHRRQSWRTNRLHANGNLHDPTAWNSAPAFPKYVWFPVHLFFLLTLEFRIGSNPIHSLNTAV
jgi:hypothetical protein